jgi:hypothetical protein
MDELFPGDHPTKGWNRASIIFWSRKPYRPKVTPADRELPRGQGVRMLGLCAVAAASLTVFCLWFPLFVAGLYVPLKGAVYGGILGGVALGLTALMYAFVARRGRRPL